MLFISPYKTYKHSFRLGDPKTGEIFTAEFAHDPGLSRAVRSRAIGMFDFRATFEGEDATNRISSFDTDIQAELEMWEPEFKEQVEEGLLSSHRRVQEGEGTGDYMLVEDWGPLAPWPGYDSIGDEQAESVIPLMLDMTMGAVTVQDVLDYERSKKNRPEVIKVLLELGAEKEEASKDIETYTVSA